MTAPDLCPPSPPVALFLPLPLADLGRLREEDEDEGASEEEVVALGVTGVEAADGLVREPSPKSCFRCAVGSLPCDDVALAAPAAVAEDETGDEDGRVFDDDDDDDDDDSGGLVEDGDEDEDPGLPEVPLPPFFLPTGLPGVLCQPDDVSPCW